MRNLIIAAFAVAVIGGLGVYSSTADGSNYSNNFDWDVIRTTDVPDPGHQLSAYNYLWLGDCYSGSQVTCPAKGTTAAVTPTFPQIDCVVLDGGKIYARFLAVSDDIPTSWPSSVSCSYPMGNHTFTANITLYTDRAETLDTTDQHAWVPSDGVIFDFDPTGSPSHGTLSAAFNTFPLPHTPTYVTSHLMAKKSGTTGDYWEGVECWVKENGISGPDTLMVGVNEDATAGTGFCAVQRTGQSTINVSVTVDRA